MLKGFLLFFLVSLNSYASDFYQFKDSVKYTQGFISIKNGKLATYYYKNESKKLIVSIHGYLDNCGYMYYMHQFFWEKDYSILCIELPGHGLSTGKRGEIDDFSSYQEMISALPTQILEKYNEVSFLGHSTGNVPMIMHLMAQKPHPFKKIIMLAPLIRSKFWTFSKWGYHILKFFTDSVPRTTKDQKHYIKLLARTKDDPYYLNFQSLKWFKKLMMWNKELIKNKNKYNEKLSLFYGDKDEVVDTEYNIHFLKKHFPNSEEIKLKDATHHMDYNPENEVFWRELTKLLTDSKKPL